MSYVVTALPQIYPTRASSSANPSNISNRIQQPTYPTSIPTTLPTTITEKLIQLQLLFPTQSQLMPITTRSNYSSQSLTYIYRELFIIDNESVEIAIIPGRGHFPFLITRKHQQTTSISFAHTIEEAHSYCRYYQQSVFRL